MTWIVIACVLGALVGWLVGFCQGWTAGTMDTERRWSDAVARTGHS